jgi:hypothetical protein
MLTSSRLAEHPRHVGRAEPRRRERDRHPHCSQHHVPGRKGPGPGHHALLLLHRRSCERVWRQPDEERGLPGKRDMGPHQLDGEPPSIPVPVLQLPGADVLCVQWVVLQWRLHGRTGDWKGVHYLSTRYVGLLSAAYFLPTAAVILERWAADTRQHTRDALQSFLHASKLAILKEICRRWHELPDCLAFEVRRSQWRNNVTKTSRRILLHQNGTV